MSRTKLALIADIHYYSPKLGVEGRAYELRSGGDQKCLAESGAVVDAVFARLKQSDIDALLIAGDVTNDGERVSHEEIREKFLDFEKTKPLYLITSTHDWCTDGNPRRFEGDRVYNDVEALDAPALDAYYAGFGKEKCIAEYVNGHGFHSRVFQVSDSLRLLAVNDDADGAGGASGYAEAHIRWAEEQIRAAKAAGNDIIAMEHHLLLPNVSPLINKGQSIADQFDMAARLADAGLRLMFVGHSHFQRTSEFVSPAGNKITQVNIGSLCGYPAPIDFLEVENGKATLNVAFSEGFTYRDKYYGADFFKEHSAAVLYNVLNAAANDKQDLKDRLASQGIRIKPLDKIYFLIRHFARKALKITVGRAGRAVNFFTFGKGIDRAALKAHKKEKLLPYIIDIFLCLFDGSYLAKDMPDTVKTIVKDVSTLPRRVVKRLPVKKAKKEKLFRTLRQIEAIAQELVYPAAPDNLHCEIDL